MFKAYQFFAGLVIAGGVVLFMNNSQEIGGAVMAAGFVWYVADEIKAWWKRN